jgi:hypothetical protein
VFFLRFWSIFTSAFKNFQKKLDLYYIISIIINVFKKTIYTDSGLTFMNIILKREFISVQKQAVLVLSDYVYFSQKNRIKIG